VLFSQRALSPFQLRVPKTEPEGEAFGVWGRGRRVPAEQKRLTKRRNASQAAAYRDTESQNSRGWKGPLWVTQPNPCPNRVTQSRGHRTLSRQVLNISREGDSTTSLGSLFQCSEGRSSSSCSDGTSCASVCAHCPLSCQTSWRLVSAPRFSHHCF